MIELVLSGLCGIAAYYAYRNEYGEHLSPDGSYYLQIAQRNKVPLPYSLRWLLPYVIGNRPGVWSGLAKVLSFTVGALVCLYLQTNGASVAGAVMGAMMFVTMSGVIRTNAIFPVLTDLCGLCLCLTSTILYTNGFQIAAFITLCIGAMVNEKVAVYTAIFTWNFWLLGFIGITLLTSLFWTKHGKTGIAWLDSPLREGLKTLRQRKDYLTCMGIAPVGLFTFDKVALVAAGVAMLTVLRSQDYARLLHWAAPTIILSAVAIIPEWLFAPLILLHIALTSMDKTV